MKAHASRVCAVLLLAVLAAPLATLAQQTNSLETLVASFGEAKAKIDAAAEQQKKDALVAYTQALDALMKASKAKGDLDGFLALETEKKRLDADQAVLPMGDDKIPKAAAEAVGRHHKTVAAVDEDTARRTGDLLRRYVAALDALVKRLTKEDKIAEAKTAKDEKGKAEFMLAEAESRLPKAEPKVDASTRIVGRWDVAFDNKAQRTYEFTEDGAVAASGTGIEGGVKGTWKVTPKGVLVDAENGKVELWKLSGDTCSVAHYNPKRNYPYGKPSATGVARKP